MNLIHLSVTFPKILNDIIFTNSANNPDGLWLKFKYWK